MQTSEYSFSIISTDWGYIAALWTNKGLYSLSYPSDLETVTGLISGVPFSKENEYIGILEDELNLYFRGYPVNFSIPLDWSGYTMFQSAVLRALVKISYGEVISYGELANMAGYPNAVRAVGSVLKKNRLPIVLPCHRVSGANGKLTGYAGGLELKKALLLLEQSVKTI